MHINISSQFVVQGGVLQVGHGFSLEIWRHLRERNVLFWSIELIRPEDNIRDLSELNKLFEALFLGLMDLAKELYGPLAALLQLLQPPLHLALEVLIRT